MSDTSLLDQRSLQERMRQERLDRYRAYLASNPSRPVLEPEIDADFLISEIALLIGPKQPTRNVG